MVCLLLANYASADGAHIFPAVATISRRTSFSRRAVQRILRRLEVVGLIEPLDQRRSRRFEYRLMTGRLRELACGNPGLGMSEVSAKGDPRSAKGDPRSAKGDPRSPNPSIPVNSRGDDSAKIMKQAADQPVEIEGPPSPGTDFLEKKKTGAARAQQRAGEQVVSHRKILTELARKKPVRRQGLTEAECDERRVVLRAQARQLTRRPAQRDEAAKDGVGPEPQDELVAAGNPRKDGKPKAGPGSNAHWRGRQKRNFATGWQP